MVTINIKVDDLQDIIDFKIKSLERALNTTKIETLKQPLRAVINDLVNARASINQHELPLDTKRKV